MAPFLSFIRFNGLEVFNEISALVARINWNFLALRIGGYVVLLWNNFALRRNCSEDSCRRRIKQECSRNEGEDEFCLNFTQLSERVLPIGR